MSNNYGEIVCQAIETVAQNLIDKVAYDRTILCTIINDDERELGKYRVQNSEAIFDAYTSNTLLKKGNQVYVSIPMGDWNEQKLIVSKKMDNINQPIAYKDPFDSFVNITNNLIGSDLKSQGLIANDPVKKQVLLWSYNKDDSNALIKNNGDILNGYTRLALSASFQTWLKELGIVSGDYGLNLIIEIEPEDSEDIKKDGNQVSSSFKVCSLNCLDMIGNPYNYESFYDQKKLFDISSLKNIKSMELWFYQKEGSFLDHEHKAVKAHAAPNIFVKDIAISLGYDTENFENDTLIIYTMDSVKYDAKKTPSESNHKQLFTRWIHKFEDGSVKVANLGDDINYDLTWYRYEQGARSHTAYSGVDWKPLATQVVAEKQATYTIIDKDWKTYNTQSLNGADTPTRTIAYNQAWLLPDITRAEEKIKAIIQYNWNDETERYESIVESTQLIFSNVSEVVNKATVDAIQALRINCEDDSFGNYLIYNLGGQIIDNAEAQKVREFKAYFNSAADNIKDDQMAELTEASSIEWIIPSQNTMIDVKDFISGNEEANYEKDGYYHIFRFGEKLDGTAKVEDDGIDGSIRNQNSQRYKIKSYYTHNYSNNTIKCVVTKNKIKYTTVKELTFGPAGTSGTDYSFVLDFSSGITALTLSSDFADGETNPAVMVKARLYDYTGKEIPNLNIKDIHWSLDEKKDTDSNNYIKIIPQTNKDEVEIQLLDEIKEVPNNNFTVLRATLNGWGDYDLNAYLPIPIRSSRKYQFISGTTTIIYNSLGYLDEFFQNPYCLYYMDANNEDSKLKAINGVWGVYSGIENDPYLPKASQNSNGQWTIRPINIYAEDSMKELCSVGSVNGVNVWSQPLFVIQNKYPSSIINSWNGELTIDKEKNAILAAKIAAGKKNDDNTFSGVIMGDWKGNDTSSAEGAITENTGLYGFQKGVASFGFRDDGTAFIGKPGFGRLEFDGTKSIIQSNRMALGVGGLKLDFDDGIIEFKNPTVFQVILKQNEWDSNQSQKFSIKGISKDSDVTLKLSQNATEEQITAWDNAKCSAIANEDNEVIVKYTKTKPSLDLSIEIIPVIIKGNILLDSTAPQTPFTIGKNFKVNWDGSLKATQGSFSGSISASTISGGIITGTNIKATNIDGSTITGTDISAATITGTDISATSIDGGTITGTYIEGGTISGSKITGGEIYGAKIYFGQGIVYVYSGSNGRIIKLSIDKGNSFTAGEVIYNKTGTESALNAGSLLYTQGAYDLGDEQTAPSALLALESVSAEGNTSLPIVIRSNERILIRSNNNWVGINSGDWKNGARVSVNKGSGVEITGIALNVNVPKEKQTGIYARFA